MKRASVVVVVLSSVFFAVCSSIFVYGNYRRSSAAADRAFRVQQRSLEEKSKQEALLREIEDLKIDLKSAQSDLDKINALREELKSR